MNSPQKEDIDYSIVIPVYFNEGSLIPTLKAIKEDVIGKNPNLTCEVIFVDDGSLDRSLEELLEIREENPDIVKVIKLTRNFGQGSAMTAGFALAKGKCVVAMSADGQDPPGLINDMLKAFFEEKYEIAVCERIGRDESFYRVITSRLFYFVIKKLIFRNMPLGGFDFVLLGRRAKDILLRNQEAHPFFQGQVLWTGFKIKFIEYHRKKRELGKSRWGFGKKITYLIDGVVSYSFFPIRFMSVLGIVVAILGFLYAGLIFISKIFWDVPVKGWAPLMITILVLSGLQMLMLGVIGEYLWRVLAQSRNRDQYIIEKIYDQDGCRTN